MAHQLLNLSKPITCFSFNKDRSEIAIGLADHTVQIFRCNTSGGKPTWTKVAHMVKHEGRVTGIDWAPESDKIVTVSSDRNAYVWIRNGAAWTPELVLLRIPRAATCVKWSPNEQKFAAGSSARLVAVCYYEKEQRCWVSKHIKKPIKSTVICIDWHPESILLAAGSSDLTCRILSTYLRDVDRKPVKEVEPGKESSQMAAPSTRTWGSNMTFAKVLHEFQCNAWVSAVRFNADGTLVAFATHDSTLNVGNAETLITNYGRNLPLTDLLWTTVNKIVGVGHDRCPFEYLLQPGSLTYSGKHTGKGAKKAGGFGNAMDRFKNLDVRAQTTSTEIDTVHSAPISALCIESGNNGAVRSFVTSGGEGLVHLWNWQSLCNSLSD
jgi:actin related protein 2/3 complex subunit 1A/1B